MSARRGKADKKRAVAYIRVSDSLNVQELGADAQRGMLVAWAAREGVTISEFFVEEVTGGADLDDRPKLMEAVAMVEESGAGFLAFSTLDRFSRDSLTAALVESTLAKVGAEVVFADGSGNGSGPTEEMVRGIRLVIAKFELRLIAGRIKAALKVKQARGEMTGAAPFGWRAVPGPTRTGRDGKARVIPVLEESPEEQKMLVTMKALAAEGYSYGEIERFLEKSGAMGRGRNGKATPIGKSAIRRILVNNPALKGEALQMA